MQLKAVHASVILLQLLLMAICCTGQHFYHTRYGKRALSGKEVRGLMYTADSQSANELLQPSALSQPKTQIVRKDSKFIVNSRYGKRSNAVEPDFQMIVKDSKLCHLIQRLQCPDLLKIARSKEGLLIREKFIECCT